MSAFFTVRSGSFLTVALAILLALSSCGETNGRSSAPAASEAEQGLTTETSLTALDWPPSFSGYRPVEISVCPEGRVADMAISRLTDAALRECLVSLTAVSSSAGNLLVDPRELRATATVQEFTDIDPSGNGTVWVEGKNPTEQVNISAVRVAEPAFVNRAGEIQDMIVVVSGVESRGLDRVVLMMRSDNPAAEVIQKFLSARAVEAEQ